MCKSLELQRFADEMMRLQQIACTIAVSKDSGFDKNKGKTFAEKLKSKPKATEEIKCMFDLMGCHKN